jgi:hypothetical protein
MGATAVLEMAAETPPAMKSLANATGSVIEGFILLLVSSAGADQVLLCRRPRCEGATFTARRCAKVNSSSPRRPPLARTATPLDSGVSGSKANLPDDTKCKLSSDFAGKFKN